MSVGLSLSVSATPRCAALSGPNVLMMNTESPVMKLFNHVLFIWRTTLHHCPPYVTRGSQQRFILHNLAYLGCCFTVCTVCFSHRLYFNLHSSFFPDFLLTFLLRIAALLILCTALQALATNAVSLSQFNPRILHQPCPTRHALLSSTSRLHCFCGPRWTWKSLSESVCAAFPAPLDRKLYSILFVVLGHWTTAPFPCQGRRSHCGGLGLLNLHHFSILICLRLCFAHWYLAS